MPHGSLLDGVSPKSQAVGMVLVAGLVFAFSHALIVDGYGCMLRPRMATTDGTVVSVSVGPRFPTQYEGKTLCALTGSYEFEVGGTKHKGTAFTSAARSAKWLEPEAARIASSLPSGTRVSVRYAAANPADNYADVEGGAGTGAMAVIFSLVFTALCASALYFVSKAIVVHRRETRMRGVPVSLRFPE